MRLLRHLSRLRPHEAQFRAVVDKRPLRRRPQGHTPHLRPQVGGARREGGLEPLYLAKLRVWKAYAVCQADGGPLWGSERHHCRPQSTISEAPIN